MCYSAQILADYRRYVRQFGAGMSLEDFAQLYLGLVEGASKAKVPKSMDAAFLDSAGGELEGVRELVAQYNANRTAALEQELFRQRKRFADAERSLQTRATKAATESRRIAADKIEATLRRLEDIARRTGTTRLADIPRLLRARPDR
jgi:hypothetical protein